MKLQVLVKKQWIVGLFIALLLVLPRVALLTNGLDSQRIWDTNTPAAFRLLAAASQHQLLDFFTEGQKYPLLGSYTFIPVIALYYGVAHGAGQVLSPDDFIRQFALGQTSLFAWLRLEMILLQAVGLLILYKAVVRCTPERQARWYLLVLCAADFYITLFSVTPRIHAFAFVAVSLTVYYSIRLMEEKSIRYHVFAFGAAAVAGSVAQSGVLAVILPVLAHLSTVSSGERWRWSVNKRLVYGLIGYGVAVSCLGYPRVFLWLLHPSDSFFSSVLLGDNHTVAQSNVFLTPLKYLFSTQYIWLWLGVAALMQRFRLFSAQRHGWDALDRILFVYVCLFFIVFGGTDVFSGRFMLAIMPAVYVLCARFLVRYGAVAWIRYPFFVLLLLEIAGIVQLTIIAYRPDTRSAAMQFILERTDANTSMIGTVDPVLLGIVLHPDSIRRGDVGLVGAIDDRIDQYGWVGPKTRTYRYQNPAIPFSPDVVQESTYVVISWDSPFASVRETEILRHGFHVVATVFGNRTQQLDSAFISWDVPAPITWKALPLQLFQFRAFGPTIRIYERD